MRLFWMVDPYSYRYRLTMPKLIILGSNDPYWPVDAVNYYWPGLPQPKLLLIDPNSGHGLDDAGRVISSLVAFYRAVAHGKLPRATWLWERTEQGLKLTMTSKPPAAQAQIWIADQPVRDFRKARWRAVKAQRQGEAWIAEVKRPEKGWRAAYGELIIDIEGRKLYASTQPRILSATKP